MSSSRSPPSFLFSSVMSSSSSPMSSLTTLIAGSANASLLSSGYSFFIFLVDMRRKVSTRCLSEPLILLRKLAPPFCDELSMEPRRLCKLDTLSRPPITLPMRPRECLESASGFCAKKALGPYSSLPEESCIVSSLSAAETSLGLTNCDFPIGLNIDNCRI